MKLVLDASVAAKWYFHDADWIKASDMRWNFLRRIHELLAPDTFLADCADTLVQSEKKKIIQPGEAVRSINDILLIRIPLHSSSLVVPRATEIAMATRLTVSAALYVALAEHEQCQYLTANQKVIRNTRKQLPFVLPFANLP